jgi:hypothetical protein
VSHTYSTGLSLYTSFLVHTWYQVTIKVSHPLFFILYFIDDNNICIFTLFPGQLMAWKALVKCLPLVWLAVRKRGNKAAGQEIILVTDNSYTGALNQYFKEQQNANTRKAPSLHLPKLLTLWEEHRGLHRTCLRWQWCTIDLVPTVYILWIFQATDFVLKPIIKTV